MLICFNFITEDKRLAQLGHIHGKSKWYKKSQDALRRQRAKPSIRYGSSNSVVALRLRNCFVRQIFNIYQNF